MPPPKAGPSTAPNLIGQLHPPEERLRLGRIHSARYPGTFVNGGEALFWVWVPTKEGGELTIEVEPGARARIRVMKAKGQVVAQTNGADLTYRVPRGEVGRLDVHVLPAALDVRASFRRTVWSRDGAKPLVPWNFWYFPYRWGSAMYPSRDIQLSAMKKWDRKLFPAGDRTLAIDWERKHHITDDPAVGAWEGHCDFAAASSIYFERPAPSPPFETEELMLLAAEWTGNHTRPDHDDCWGSWQQQPRLVLHSKDAEPKTGASGHLLRLLRPDDWNDEPGIVLHAKSRYREAFPDVYDRSADRIAKRAEELLGSEAGRARVKKCFADSVVELLRFVDRRLGVEGHPLLTDIGGHWMPDPRGATAAHVWNHVMFAATIDYVEPSPPQVGGVDPRCIDLTVDFAFNADRAPTRHSPALPANFVDGVVVPNDSAERLRFDARATFTSSGELESLDAHHLLRSWPSGRWIPRQSDVMLPPGLAIQYANPVITDEVLTYLTKRARYR